MVTIIVRLDPQVGAQLSAEARAQGIPLNVYVETFIAQAATAADRPQVSLEDFDAGLEALAEGSETLPVLPPEAYQRESIYGDA